MTFSDRVKKLRKERKLTQLELSRAVDVGIRTIRRIEADKDTSEPTLSTLNKLADYFDVSIDYLTGRSDVREH